MKTVIYTIVLLVSTTFSSFSLKAQHVANRLSYEGYWMGELKSINDNNELLLILKIENGQAKRLFYDEDSGEIEEFDFLKETSERMGNNFSFVWMNEGGIWSETQSHSLSYLKPKELWCILVRQVTNAKEDDEHKGINNEWNLIFKGGISSYKSILALREQLER